MCVSLSDRMFAEPVEIDPIYQLLKQAGDIGGTTKKSSMGSVEKELAASGGGGSGGSSGSSLSSLNKRTSKVQGASSQSLAVSAIPPPSSCSGVCACSYSSFK